MAQAQSEAGIDPALGTGDDTTASSNPPVAPSDPNAPSPYLLNGIAAVESNNGQNETGPVTKYGTAKGKYQMIDSTGKTLFDRAKAEGDVQGEYDPYDDNQEEVLATNLVKELKGNFGGDERLALAAYNSNPALVKNLQKEYGNSYDDIAAHLPPETQKYVPRVLFNQEKAKNAADGSTEEPQKQADVAADIKSVPPTAQGFAKAALPVISDPEFDTLPLAQKAAKLNTIFQSRNWSTGTKDVLKQAMTNYWDSSPDEEKPNFNDFIQPPPFLKPGDTPDTVLTQWKQNQIRGLYQKKIPPQLFGNALDSYLDSAATNEKDAFAARSRGFIGNAVTEIGGDLLQTLKGVASAVTTTAAAVPRLTGNQDLADKIDSLPEMLGKPARDYLYQTDRNGYVKFNPDLTPQTRWQASAAETVGQIGAFIGSGWALGAAGVGAEVTSGILGSANALSLANGSFKTVYNDTNGDYGKSLTAGILSMPVGFVGELGRLQVLSKEVSPIIQEMTGADQSLYLAKSLVRNTAIGALSGAAMDVGQQGAEISQTGKPFSIKRTEEAAATTGAAGGLIGSIHDYVNGSVSSFAQGKMKAIGDAALVDFRNSTDSERTISVPAVSKDILDTFGMDVTSNNNGTVTVTKRGYTPPEGQTIKELTDTLATTYSSDDIKDIGAKQAALSVKQNRTPEESAELTKYNQILGATSSGEYQNYVKGIERAIEDHPDKYNLGVSRDPSTNLWEHPVNGQSLALKDVLTPKEPEYTTDVSDLSKIGIFNKPEIEARALQTEPISTEAAQAHANLVQQSRSIDEEVNQLKIKQNELPPKTDTTPSLHEGELLRIAEELKDRGIELKTLQNERDSIPKKVKGEEDPHAEQRANVADQLKQKTIEIRKLGIERDALPLKEEIDPTIEEKRQRIRDQLTQKDTEKRLLEPKLNAAKDLRDQERLSNKDKLQAQRDFKKQKDKDLAFVNKIRKGRVAEYDPTTHTIKILAHDTPEAMAESVAHELGHAVAKDAGLSKGANDAVDNLQKDLQASIPVAKVKDLVNKTFLPNARERVLRNVPENADAKNLNKKGEGSVESIINRDEILGNQIGAIMLKRAGHDIGDFKILPEVEASLRKTKLPDVNEVLNPQKVNRINEGVNVEKTQNTSTNVAERPSESVVPSQTTQTSNNLGTEPPKFNTETGEVGETRFSKKVRAVNPNIPANEYNRVSEALGREQAGSHIGKNGIENTQKYLSTNESFKMDPKDRSALVEELFARRQAEFNAKSTPKTAADLNLAYQLRAKAGTAYAQGLGVLTKFRNAETFADLVGNINRAYIDAGMKPPDYTQAMIDELRGNFEKADKLPKGSRARNAEVDNIFAKTLGFNKTNWGTFLAKYARTNLLSGFGTQLVVATSSIYMGPVLTALAHPYQGGGLVWRAMWHASGLAASNARAVLAGEGGKALFNGIYDPSPVNMGTKPTVESGFAKMYSKYGDMFLNGLAATHTFAKTLSAEGFLANRGYNELKAQYGNAPAKFSAEVSKLILNPKDIETAKAQATREYSDAGIQAKPGTIGARAYEILRTQSNTPVELQSAEEYAKGVSHAGEMANVTHQAALTFFNSPIFTQNPFMAPVRFIVQPFGRAMLALSDYAIDYIPGNIAIDPALRRLGNALDSARGGDGDYFKPRSEALQTRLRNAQAVGAVMSATLLGLSRSGLFTITGDEEKSDIEGEGKDFAGGQAANRADFAEAKQKGVPAYSIVFKNGFSIDYKDLPGLNALAYGIFRVNKAIDSGESAASATAAFYKGAFSYAIPFFGGGTLNSPMYTLGQAILNPETDPKKAGDAIAQSAERWNKFYQQSADTAEKFLVPFSSLLRDVQQTYDQPEESHQELLQRAFRNVPGVSTLVGSQNQVDRFGDPVQRTGLEHTPGVGRIVGSVTPESGDVWDKLNAKGLIVKEMGNYINFHKADVGSGDKFDNYQKTREERIGSAYAKTLTPDEWNQFRAATGPYIKAAANSIADSDLPHDTAQETLTKRINAIEEQSLKRYVSTGKF